MIDANPAHSKTILIFNPLCMSDSKNKKDFGPDVSHKNKGLG